MKLINTDNQQFTKIKKDEFGYWDIQAAADRLISRVMPRHFCNIHYYDFEQKSDHDLIGVGFDAEALYPAGLTEHTNKKFYFEIRS